MPSSKLFMYAALLVFSVGIAYGGQTGHGGMDMDSGHSMTMDMDAEWSEEDDADFLAGMIVHHQGALDMAAKVVDSTRDPSVARWSKDIIASQQAEIDAMQRLLDGMLDKGAVAASAMAAEMTHMLAMRASDDPDVNFVALMVPHHLGAIDMSVPALASSDNPAIRKLAQAIIIAQTNEVAEFRDWLDKNW